MHVVPEKFAPVMVVQEPCEKPGRKLPPFSTLVMTRPVIQNGNSRLEAL
jgi:hypothetical protein